MGKYKYKKPKTSTMSTVPAIYALRETVEAMNMLVKDMPKRIDRGRVLFLIAMAEFARREVMRKAPDIEMGNSEYPYAEHLRIGVVDGGDSDLDAVAVYFKNQKVVLDKENKDDRALYFQPTQGSPEWVSVLMVYGPWPSSMVPVPSDSIRGRVISRDARPDELNALTDRIYTSRGKIESDLRAAGAQNATIGKTANAEGVVVHDDVGYNILRKEFGYDGSDQVAHWRPALKAMKDVMPDLMRRYLNYLKTGRESAFELPKNIGDVNTMLVNKGAEFAKTLAPFAPRG